MIFPGICKLPVDWLNITRKLILTRTCYAATFAEIVTRTKRNWPIMFLKNMKIMAILLEQILNWKWWLLEAKVSSSFLFGNLNLNLRHLIWYWMLKNLHWETVMSGSCHLDRASIDKFSAECLFWFFQPKWKLDLKVVQSSRNYLFRVKAPL